MIQYKFCYHTLAEYVYKQFVICRRYDWTYVSIVYTDTEYGIQGYETLSKLAGKYNVCFSTPQRVSKEHFEERDYDIIVQRLANNSHARGSLNTASMFLLLVNVQPHKFLVNENYDIQYRY